MTRRSGFTSSWPTARRCLIASLRHRLAKDPEWQDAVVVALQIHGVSELTRRTLSAEAHARGESLQEYLLDLLDREARDVDNRRLREIQPVDFVKLIGAEREDREVQLAHGG
jgi:hypothetical protein